MTWPASVLNTIRPSIIGVRSWPEWVALILLVGTLVLFGVAPGIAIGPIDTATVPLLSRLGVLP